MSPEFLAKVLDPFVTSRTTRNVGLGLPMFAAAAQACGGDLRIDSTPGKGTVVEAWFELGHIDRAPFGDITSTIVNTVAGSPDVSFRYEQVVNGREFVFDTDEISSQLAGVPLNDPLVIGWMKPYIEEGLDRVGRVD